MPEAPKSHSLTRQELYDRVWSTPMTQLVAEFGMTTGRLTTLLRRADIPAPRSGHWMRKQHGKPVTQDALPPAPPGHSDPLALGPHVAVTQPDTSAVPAVQSEAPEAVPVEQPPPMPGPVPEPKVRPTKATTLTRQELYAAVWATPMIRLAEQYEISGNGLAKICDRAGIPCPPRGYWAQLAVGKAPAPTPLPELDKPRSVTIHPTPVAVTPPEPPDAIQAEVEAARSKAASMTVPQRLAKPHAIIARWLEDHEDKKRRARQERNPSLRGIWMPAEWTECDRRRHRILDALFKAIERQGGEVRQGERFELFAKVQGERVEFAIREKQKQTRRPLTDSERRYRVAGDNDWRREMMPTGKLVFDVKTYLPGNLRRQWLETNTLSMEDMLPDIVGTIIAAGPLLVKQRLDREEAERQRQIAERLRYEEQRRRKRDANQWRHYSELAGQWREVALAREFTEALKGRVDDPTLVVGGRPVAEWLEWAEVWLSRVDPLAKGVDGVFGSVAQITDWTYRD